MSIEIALISASQEEWDDWHFHMNCRLEKQKAVGAASLNNTR